MAAPTFVASYSSVYDTGGNPKTVSVTTQPGDIVIVYAGSENGLDAFNTPTGNSISFTTEQSVHVNNTWADAAIWSGVDSTGGTNWTLSLSRTTTGQWFGLTCLVFRNSDGVGASAKINTTSSGSAALNLTTTQANSAVVTFATDWNTGSGTTRTWKTVNGVTPSNGNGLETSFHYDASHYIALGAYYNDVGAIGSSTYGYDTGASLKYSMVVLEVKGSTPPPSSNAPIATLTDDFNDNSIDTGKWTTGVAAGSSITETGGQLVIAPPVSGTGYSYLDSNDTFSLVGSSLTVEFAGTISTATGVEQIMEIMIDDSNYIMFFIANTGAAMRLVTAAADDSTYTTRDDRMMHWARIRESSGTIYWETSPDRTNWTIQRSAPSTFSLTSLKVRLSAGCWQSVASPGTAKFDNINLESQTYRNTAEGQTNGTTLSAANSGGGSGDAYGVVTTSGTVSATYSTDMSVFGAQSYKVTSGTTSALYVRAQASGAYSGTCQMYLYLPTYADNNQLFIGMADSGGSYPARLSINQTGTIRINNYASSTIYTSSSGIIPTGQWIRLDLSAIVGSSTSDGRILAQASYANSFTPFWTYDSGASVNAGTNPITEYRFGKMDTTPNIALFYYDDSAWRPNMSAFIPPQSSSPSVGWFTA